MLRIEISSDGLSRLSFSKLEQFDIPSPKSGFNPEVNDNVIMQFEDEQEAIDYAHSIDKYAELLSDQTCPEYLVASDIIKAISDDEFVQAYIQG